MNSEALAFIGVSRAGRKGPREQPGAGSGPIKAEERCLQGCLDQMAGRRSGVFSFRVKGELCPLLPLRVRRSREGQSLPSQKGFY